MDAVTDMRVRVADQADIPTLFDIRASVVENAMTLAELAEAGVTPETVAAAMGTSSRVWLAEVGGEPAAFSMANDDEGCVFAMFVRPQFEAGGLGRALMAEAERYLFRNHGTIWLTTGVEEGIRAHGFYRRLGWRAIGLATNGELRYEKSIGKEEERMSKKGYWMAMVDISDPDGYPQYIAANKAAFDKYGARFVVRGGRGEVLEGPEASRLVVVEFDSYQTALDCYRSPEYQAALKLRRQFSNAHFAIVEGV